jgi:6,7-dimethyl-8-ribityllumazine synthase
MFPGGSDLYRRLANVGFGYRKSPNFELYRRVAISITVIWLGISTLALGGLAWARDDLALSFLVVFGLAGFGVLVSSVIGLAWLIVLPWARREPKVGLVTALYNKDGSVPVADLLGDGARKSLIETGIKPTNIVQLDVAGAWELPWGASRLIQAGCQGVVATGVVMEGETHHFRSVVDGAVQGLIQLQVDTGVPVGNAVLAVSRWEQAVARSEPGNNAGALAARAVVEALRSEIR